MASLDVHDADDLRKSLEAWERELARETRIVARHEKLAQKARATIARRRAQLAAARKRDFGTRVVAQALKWVGQSESPTNSNKGRNITRWQERFGLKGGGYPWCGAFAGSMVEAVGGDVTNRVVYTPYIVADAKAGTNGFVSWTSNPADAKVGDLVLFNFPGGAAVEHVGILRKLYAGKGVVLTVEGNTSPGDAGSQDNGGGVYLRSRPLNLVAGFARPKGA